MQDQVAGLAARGVAVDYLSSSRTAAERDTLLARLDALAMARSKGSAEHQQQTQQQQQQQKLQLLYVTPELLATDRHARMCTCSSSTGYHPTPPMTAPCICT